MDIQGLIQTGFIIVICVYTARAVLNILLVNRKILLGKKAFAQGLELETPEQLAKHVQEFPGHMGRTLRRYFSLLQRKGRLVLPSEYFVEAIPEDIRNEWNGQRNRLILFGLLGTFAGLAYAVYNIAINTDDVQNTLTSIQAAQVGMKTAFVTSIFGIVGALLVGLLIDFSLKRDMHVMDVVEDFCVYKLIPNFAPDSAGGAQAPNDEAVALIQQAVKKMESVAATLGQASNPKQPMSAKLVEFHSELMDLKLQMGTEVRQRRSDNKQVMDSLGNAVKLLEDLFVSAKKQEQSPAASVALQGSIDQTRKLLATLVSRLEEKAE